MDENKIRNENQVPYECLNWCDVYVQYEGIEGEFKFTLTDKSQSSKMAVMQTLETLDYLVQLSKEGSVKVRGPFNVGSAVVPPASQHAKIEAEPSEGGADFDGQFQLDRLEYAPRTDGKVNANYFAPGMQWPTIYSARTKDQLSAMVNQMWGLSTTPEAFDKAGKLDVHGTVFWKNSDKKNSRGNPYKNIVRIEL